MATKGYRFSKDGTSCLISCMQPPRHWYNYLWNENGYCSQISQMGHGRSYYINEKADMCMINSHDARYVYLRDDESGECWNIGYGPMNTAVTDYECEHSISHSTLHSSHDDISASWRLFVPQDGFHEQWTVVLKNTGFRPRSISLFSAVSFDLEGFSYPRYYEMYRCMETSFDPESNGLFCASAHPFAPHNRYNGFLVASEPPFAYDGDLARFCGTNSTVTKLDASVCALFQHPQVVVQGMDCTCSEGALFVLGGVLQHKLTLGPGAEKEIRLAFGVSESLEKCREIAAQLRDRNACEKAFQLTVEHNRRKYDTLSISTPDKQLTPIMNQWIKKQVDFCIVGKKGVRDNLQIAVALLQYRPEKAREEILECLRHQFQDGHAVLTWYPYDDTRYSDQPFWIIWAVCELIKETGDFSILEETIEWQDGGNASVMEHIKAAVNRLLLDKGPNGLIRIFFADWNDALNITTDPEAESVMLSEQCCLAFKELSVLAEKSGDTEYAHFLMREYNVLKAQINASAWDGEWYMRALSKEENIGSKNSEGSRIYLNAQTWAVLADVVPEQRLSSVLASIDGMEHDFGFPLNLPPYQQYTAHTGRMSGMLPGLFENGGVYCHATGFKILMDCKMGRAEKALQTLKKIMPDSEKNPSSQSGAEPYVFTNCYATHPKYYGKSYQSWTTGTSAWAMMSVCEGLMGVKRDYDGLRIAPCFPASWDHAEMTRRFRRADYHIIIYNPDHLENGTPSITVDDHLLEGNLLPDFRDGQRHEVIVTLR